MSSSFQATFIGHSDPSVCGRDSKTKRRAGEDREIVGAVGDADGAAEVQHPVVGQGVREAAAGDGLVGGAGVVGRDADVLDVGGQVGNARDVVGERGGVDEVHAVPVGRFVV